MIVLIFLVYVFTAKIFIKQLFSHLNIFHEIMHCYLGLFKLEFFGDITINGLYIGTILLSNEFDN